MFAQEFRKRRRIEPESDQSRVEDAFARACLLRGEAVRQMPRLGTKQGGCLACGLKEGGPSGEVRLFAIAENAIADQAHFLGTALDPMQYSEQEWIKMLQGVSEASPLMPVPTFPRARAPPPRKPLFMISQDGTAAACCRPY